MRGFWNRLKSQAQADVERQRNVSSVTDNAPNDEVDLSQIYASTDRNRSAEIAGRIQGRHFSEWVPDLNRLKSLGADAEEEYLSLVLECVDAAERAALILDQAPAPGYTNRAAIVYRRRREYEAEIQILERWIAACPERFRGDADSKVAVRLIRAIDLRDKMLESQEHPEN